MYVIFDLSKNSNALRSHDSSTFSFVEKTEIEILKEAIDKLKIPIERVKEINIHWEPIFEQRAFPKIVIKLYKQSNKTENINNQNR